MDKSDALPTRGETVTGARAIPWHRLVGVSDATASQGGTGARDSKAGRRLAIDLALYTLARLVLVVVLTAVIVGAARLLSVQIPLVVAALFAIVVAMPLSLTLFKSLRTRVNEGIAAVDAQRRQDKAQLRARLRGDADGKPPA